MWWAAAFSIPSPVPSPNCYTLVMFEPADVLAVHSMIEMAPKRLTGIRVFFKDGTSKAFHEADLAAALAVVKIAFPPRPGSTWISDQPLPQDCPLRSRYGLEQHKC